MRVVGIDIINKRRKTTFFKVIKCGIPSIPSLRGGALLRVRNIA
jgi:hypothetical protein